MEGVITNLHWQSDWNGYEVGFDEINVVGLYTSETLSCSFYIDTETNQVLEVLPEFMEER